GLPAHAGRPVLIRASLWEHDKPWRCPRRGFSFCIHVSVSLFSSWDHLRHPRTHIRPKSSQPALAAGAKSRHAPGMAHAFGRAETRDGQSGRGRKMSSRSLASRARGFTLVALMIVVALVGLLSAIALPDYLRFQMRARRSEGSVNVGALRTGQLSYYGLWGEFASPRSPNPDPHPLDGTRRPWNYSDPDWQMLAFDPDGEVYFQYWTQGGRG